MSKFGYYDDGLVSYKLYDDDQDQIYMIQIHHWIFGESEVQINGKVLGSQCGNKVSFLECIILPLKEDLNPIFVNIYLLQNIKLFAKF